jgi:hypothetical protein
MNDFINSYDFITPIILIVVFLPLLISLFYNVSKSAIWISLVSMLRFVELIISVFFAYSLTKILCFDNQILFFQKIKNLIISNINGGMDKNIIIYAVVSPIFFIFIYLLFRLITKYFETELFVTLAEKLHEFFNLLWSPVKILLRLIISLPRASLNLFIICLILAVCDLYLPSSAMSDQIEQSKLYNTVHQFAIEPILKSSYVQKLPVLFNQTAAQFSNSSALAEDVMSSGKLPDRLSNGTRVIWYFNGITIDQAIKSNESIDSFARELVGSETDSGKKARKIYRWVGTHIKYDFDKAEKVIKTETDMPSGAINAFDTHKGICFDYSSLYVAMCKAVGVKVRLIAGMGFDGSSWGEHAWNQVYIPDEDCWINVDTTFAIGGNYFDRPGFEADHKSERIAGEW